MEPPDIPYPPPDTPFMPLHPAWKPGDRPSESGADLRPLDLEAGSPKSQGSAWLLTVYWVPPLERYTGLVSDLGFQQNRKNPNHWSRRFEPWEEDRTGLARWVLSELNREGLRNRHWMKVAAKPKTELDAKREAAARLEPLEIPEAGAQ